MPESRQSMRIAQLIGSMSVGGAENLAVRVAGTLAARGHDSHLIVEGGPGSLSTRISPRVHTHYLRFERDSITRPMAFAVSVSRGLARIASIVSNHRVDVVQTHLPGANFWGLPLELARVCPVVATIHNNQEFNYGHDSGGVRAVLRKQAYRWLLRVNHGVVAVSDEVKRSLIAELGVSAALGERISVARNGVDVPAPLPWNRRSELRARYGASGRALVLAVGRLTAQKNFGDLLRAFAIARQAERAGAHASAGAHGKVSETERAFKLVIAGEGDERASLEAQAVELGIADDVELPGNLDHVSELMQAADLLVMTSLWEGLPLVALEAQAAGLPILAYAIPGTEELIDDGVTGFLSPVGEPAVLGRRLAEVLAAPDALRSTGDAGRRQVERDYSFERTVDRLLEVYRRSAS